MFDNPKTTIFQILTAVFCLLVPFTPFATLVDLANFNSANTYALILAVAAIVLALDALVVIFFGLDKNKKALAKLKRQLTFNKITSYGIFTLLLAFGAIVYLNNLFENPNIEWAFPPLALISNLIAGNSINSDIRMLKSEDRLR